MTWDEFVIKVGEGKVNLDELDHVFDMYRQYKTATPKIQKIVEYLLETGADSETNLQD